MNAHPAVDAPAALRSLSEQSALQSAFAEERRRQSLLLRGNDPRATGGAYVQQADANDASPGRRQHSAAEGPRDPSDTGTRILSRNLTIGIVANEFFASDLGRMGGFGWSTRMVAEVFQRRSDLNVRLIFIFADPTQRQRGSREKAIARVHGGWPLINLRHHEAGPRGSRSATTAWARRYLQAAQLDAFLFIDYRTVYLAAHTAMPHVPIILWARDPRTEQQAALIQASALAILMSFGCPSRASPPLA